MDKKEEFEALRKSLKRKGTEQEDNYVTPYRDDNVNQEPRSKSSAPSTAVVDNIRYHNSIEVDDESSPPDPITTFEDANLPPETLDYLRGNQIQTPTPVQMQAIPILLAGRDAVIVAPTGSGKTLGYLLPLYTFMKRKYQQRQYKKPATPVALIVTPTRELMQQVLETAMHLLDSAIANQTFIPPCHNPLNSTHHDVYQYQRYPAGLNPAVHNISTMQSNSANRADLHQNQGHSQFYNQQMFASPGQPTYHEPVYSVYGLCGGVPVQAQAVQLKESIDIVVATPGRLLELSQRNLINLSSVSFLVIDECDKMLELGLEEQLRKIVALITINDIPRQTSLWSATLPDSLERLARSAVLNPVTMHVGLKDTVCKNISQNIIFMHSYQKPKRLLQTLRSTDFPPVIVFASTITVVDEIVELLKEEEFHAEGLHSHKSQEQRFKTLFEFRKGTFDVLVATDLASRGLDITGITHVINYDTPNTIEDYIHRCGRTGRFGRVGAATTFLTLDCKIAAELKDLLESSGLPVPKDLQDTKQFGKKVLKTEFGDRIL
eukprot:gene7411-8231_t